MNGNLYCDKIGMLVYRSSVTLFLGYVGLSGLGGILLWPAVALHGILSVLLALSLTRNKD